MEVYTISVIERLLSKTEVSDNGCWNWTGAKTNNGYGTACVNYKQKSAHRHMYHAVFGEVSSKLHIDHLCRNRLCVNPAHLEPVTARENILRGLGIAAKNSVKTMCNNGHAYTKSNTYLRFRNNSFERDCKKCRTLAAYRHNSKRKIKIG